jgi:hypothetical protein
MHMKDPKKDCLGILNSSTAYQKTTEQDFKMLSKRMMGK